ncbi:MAG: TlpA family protein disulfide reductase [Bacteroides sp.]|nr:TlpA family protein disulfide reductase [Bacteroides sp.]
MKRTLFLYAALAYTACVSATVPTAEDILTKILENVSKIHTASYNITERVFYTPDDSLYIDEEVYRIVECENPTDTVGLPIYIRQNETGRLRIALSPEYSYYDRVTHIEKSRRHGPGYSWAPFYNRVMRMCEYFLKPSDNLSLTVIDRGDEWEIDASVSGHMIIFSGYPRVVEMSSADHGSHFGLRVDKSTMMPVWVSFLLGLPASRYEESVSNVELNSFAPETFSVSDYFNGLSTYEGEEERALSKKWSRQHLSEIRHAPLPTDTLTTLDGTLISLVNDTTRAKVIFFATTHCGICHAAIPSINNIYESYPADRVQIFGVMHETRAQPRGIMELLKRENVRVPMALNNGRFYEYFYPDGLAPAIIVIDRKGKIALIQNGFNAYNPKQTEKRIREAIDAVLRDHNE